MKAILYPQRILIFIVFVALTAACTPAALTTPNQAPSAQEKLKVVATTTIVGDIVSQVGKEQIDLAVLLPYGADPHSFQPTPQDIARVADSDLVVVNGAGLEEFLESLLENAGGSAQLIDASEGIELLHFAGEAEQEEDPDHNDENHRHEGGDPHTWTDPHNVMVWVKNIARALQKADPDHAAAYEDNAQAYLSKLRELDAWIMEETAKLPAERRKIVTDHLIFGYLAKRYGFEQTGAILPGYSTLAEPSAQELAQLEDAIRQLNIPAIFVGKEFNPALAQRISEDTGIKLIAIYSGSLSEPGGPAGSYLEYMRFNVSAIVNALQ